MAAKTKRIVLKFGSGILARASGNGLDARQFSRLTSEAAELVLRGHECLIVSSGAVAAGMNVLKLRERPTDLATGQACAALGQSKLMRAYETAFARHKLNVAQLLLTHGDLDSRMRHSNARNTLRRLLAARNVVPIINENDSVAVEELKFGDNDRLSAEVAMLADADLLIILTTVDGLLDDGGALIPVVDDVERATQFVTGKQGKFSVGGMTSKLQAVKIAVEAGISTVIINGRTAGSIAAVMEGKEIGTRFVPKRRR